MSISDDRKIEVRGRVLRPGDDDFDTARRPWNLAVEQRVSAVVTAADADDVTALVRHAAATGRTIATQPTGHGATGDLDGAILLRTNLLDDVRVDPGTRTARVGAGVSWGRVLAAAGAHGLTGLAGSSPVVGVTGYTLGGGLSWFGRAYGWAADSVLAFDVVTADGTPARVTADRDADLFWALCGGGGDLAIVTAIEFRLHPAPELYGGRMLWPASRTPQVLDAFRQVTADAPAALTVWLDLLHFPGAEPMVAADVTYLGAEAPARSLLDPLDRIGGTLSDSRRILPVADLGSIAAEPTDPSPGLTRAVLLDRFDDDVAGALLADPLDPLLGVQVRHLGGAFAQPSQTPFGPLTEPFYLYALGVPVPAARAYAIRDRLDGLVAALGDAVSRRKPLTALAAGESVADTFTPEALARLRDLKRSRDPHSVFRGNFPLIPG